MRDSLHYSKRKSLQKEMSAKSRGYSNTEKKETTPEETDEVAGIMANVTLDDNVETPQERDQVPQGESTNQDPTGPTEEAERAPEDNE